MASSPAKRAKKAAKALDLYEQALNLAMEIVREWEDAEAFTEPITDNIHTGHEGFRVLRKFMESELRITKEGTA